MNQEIIREWASETLEEMIDLSPGEGTSVARLLHSIKGTASFLELQEFVDLANAGEELLATPSSDIKPILKDLKGRLEKILTPDSKIQDPYTRVRKDLLKEMHGWTQELALLQNEIKEHLPDLLMQRLSRIIHTLQEITVKTQMGLMTFYFS